VQSCRPTSQPDPAIDYLEPIALDAPDFGELYDELPLWSAPFGLLLLERVPIRPELTILDVGAGTGFVTIELAQRCGPTATLIAVDPWPGAIERLRRKLLHCGIENVRLLEQDAASVDLADDSVDVVVSNLGINNFTNAQAVLRTCMRVMKPAGRLLLTTNLIGHMAEFYAIYRSVLIELRVLDRLTVLDSQIQRRGTIESVTALLHEAGFTPGRVSSDSFTMRFADGSSLLRHYFVRLAFIPGWLSIVSSADVARTFRALESRLNALAAQQGGLTLTIPMACFEAVKP
jgi:arsenite methyltransferase